MSKRKNPKKSPRTASNRDRDNAIGHLYNGMDQVIKEVRSANHLIALYIEFRKDEKRFRNWIERKNKSDVKKAEKMEAVKDKLAIHEEEIRRENG